MFAGLSFAFRRISLSKISILVLRYIAFSHKARCIDETPQGIVFGEKLASLLFALGFGHPDIKSDWQLLDVLLFDPDASADSDSGKAPGGNISAHGHGRD